MLFEGGTRGGMEEGNVSKRNCPPIEWRDAVGGWKGRNNKERKNETNKK